MQKEYVIGYQAAPGQHFDGKEIRAGKHRQMHPNEFLPGGLLLALQRRCDAIPLQRIADRLIRYLMAEVSQCANDSIVPPPGVLPSHADD